jgi:hypothetical protein
VFSYLLDSCLERTSVKVGMVVLIVNSFMIGFYVSDSESFWNSTS